MYKAAIAFVIICGLHSIHALSDGRAVHLPLLRRGGRFTDHKLANLTDLTIIVTLLEARYARTYRKAEKNRLVRRWRSDKEAQHMLDELGLDGNWYTSIQAGDPLQSIDVDVDMLSPDWYSLMTSSGTGSKYDTFLSNSHVTGEQSIHSICRLASDTFRLNDESVVLDWPMCQPSHSSRHTLRNSGTVLGLAPSSNDHPSTLSRLNTPPLLSQLYARSIVTQPIWSLSLLDSTIGILSLGGSLAREVEEIKSRTEIEFQYLGQDHISSEVIEKEVQGRLSLLGPTIEEQFRWIDVHGSEGWWMGLMSGIWVNGVKILKNQPFLLDISLPFILAPSSAATHLYDSIPGSLPLPPPPPPANHSTNNNTHNPFSLYPCLNPPAIALELSGWPIPLTQPTTRLDTIHGPAGGAFSLGKLNDLTQPFGLSRNESLINSGYCVGIILSSDMGQRTSKEWRASGMKDTWVLGAPFFRGVGVVFDPGVKTGKARMGFRVY